MSSKPNQTFRTKLLVMLESLLHCKGVLPVGKALKVSVSLMGHGPWAMAAVDLWLEGSFGSAHCQRHVDASCSVDILFAFLKSIKVLFSPPKISKVLFAIPKYQNVLFAIP
jgi:hypothetical protein